MKEIYKKIIAYSILIVFALILVILSSNENSKQCVISEAANVEKQDVQQIQSMKIHRESRDGQIETWILVDEETGVNYIVVAPNYSEKRRPYDGISITPRLNEDKSLYTTK